ncbi:MAG: glutathione S-transferase N-terminal domain-containing protein [Rhodothermaceae bacterium]
MKKRYIILITLILLMIIPVIAFYCSDDSIIVNPLPEDISKSKTIILHHTSSSPYAQKIKLLLGYTETKWLSVIAPPGTPRPVQELLADGYSRRIPIMQIGADIFCDTDIITNELAEITEKRELGRIYSTFEIDAFVGRAETDAFQFMLNSISKWKLVKGYFNNLSFRKFVLFIVDRSTALSGEQTQKYSPEEAQNLVSEYFIDLNKKLKTNQFLFTQDKPTIADFSAFHMMWYKESLNDLSIPDNLQSLKKWYKKMKSFGNGFRYEIYPEDAVEIAKLNSPRVIPDSMKVSPNIGMEISLKPTDVVGELTPPVTGILVGENKYKYIIKRETVETGIIHIHFPKKAYGACL